MNAFTRIIIVLVVINLMVTGLVMAQQTGNVSLSVSSSGPVDENPSTSAMESDYVESVAIDETATNAANIDLATSFVNFSSQSGSTEAVLVIPTAEIKTEDIITINEDMNVMSRIFEKNLEQDRITTVTRGIFVSRRDVFTTLLGSGGSEIQSMYLQGYGALFLMKVDFPLSPPPDVQEEEREIQKTKESDPVWAQVRQEMYEPEKAARRNADRSAEKYDAERVGNLKTTLLKTLKHAANIQALKSDEQVIITVVGRAGQSYGDSIAAYKMISGTDQAIVRYKDARTRLVKANVQSEIGLSLPTVLTIRAKKLDIDAFSKGDLDYDQFRQRTQLLTYPHLAGGTGSRESLGFSRPIR